MDRSCGIEQTKSSMSRISTVFRTYDRFHHSTGRKGPFTKRCSSVGYNRSQLANSTPKSERFKTMANLNNNIQQLTFCDSSKLLRKQGSFYAFLIKLKHNGKIHKLEY